MRTREETEQFIREATEALKGPMSSLERTHLVAELKDAQARVAALTAAEAPSLAINPALLAATCELEDKLHR